MKIGLITNHQFSTRHTCHSTGPKFIEVTSSSLNVTVIAVRGTDVMLLFPFNEFDIFTIFYF